MSFEITDAEGAARRAKWFSLKGSPPSGTTDGVLWTMYCTLAQHYGTATFGPVHTRITMGGGKQHIYSVTADSDGVTFVGPLAGTPTREI